MLICLLFHTQRTQILNEFPGDAAAAGGGGQETALKETCVALCTC